METTTVAPASIDAVWDRLADASTWSEWGQCNETALDREGVPAPDGVGAIVRLALARFIPDTARRLARVAAADR